MESKKLELKPLLAGMWIFIKEQFKCLGTWVMISFFAYFGSICLGFLGGLFVSLGILSISLVPILGISQDVIPYVSSLLNFINKPLLLILLLLLGLIFLFLAYKISKKSLGLANSLIFNVLAAVEHKTLPRFSVRDERLSVVGLIFAYFFLIAVGIALLIIPGIIVLIRFSMAYIIMLDEKCSVWSAFKKSWKLTEGNFWPLFVFIFPMVLLSQFIPIISIIYMFIPLNGWILGYIYNKLKQRTVTN